MITIFKHENVTSREKFLTINTSNDNDLKTNPIKKVPKDTSFCTKEVRSFNYYIANELNSKPVLRFDGANDYLTTGTPFLNTTSSEGTIFVVGPSTQLL